MVHITIMVHWLCDLGQGLRNAHARHTEEDAVGLMTCALGVYRVALPGVAIALYAVTRLHQTVLISSPCMDNGTLKSQRERDTG